MTTRDRIHSTHPYLMKIVKKGESDESDGTTRIIRRI
jgi:hypothetical protein